MIGLLYGKGDFGATIDISTRCGYDSDCNPANSGGILGTMIGYSNIPEYWKKGIDKVENIKFPYTSLSLNDVYETGFRHASEMIKRNNGNEETKNLIIKYQEPGPVPLEIGFEGLYPVSRSSLKKTLSAQNPEISFSVAGSGFVLTGRAAKDAGLPDLSLEIDLFAGEKLLETIKLPTLTKIRRHDIAWNYDLPEGSHFIVLKARNVPKGYRVEAMDLLQYTSEIPEKRVYFE